MSRTFIMRVQHRLNEYGAGLKEDGEAGPATNSALDTYLPAKPAADTGKPFDPASFFAGVRGTFGSLSQGQVDGFSAVLAAVKGWPVSWQAYALATAWHETGETMQPVREAHWLSEAWRQKNLRYWPHYGRGFVQITWPKNYEWLDKASAEAGLTKPGEILANLDLAMRPDIAALALRLGLEEGRYDSHGKRMAARLPKGRATREQYVDARYLVNIQDKAEEIAGYALAFESALIAGGWT